MVSPAGKFVNKNIAERGLIRREDQVTVASKFANNSVPNAQEGAFGADDGSTVSTDQPFRYTGMPFDNEGGLGLYYYGARYYDPVTGRFISIDPLWSKYPGLSPYLYCANNPIALIDRDGREPGDPFPTMDAAAADFGKCFREKSAAEDREYGSSIYKINETEDQTTYTYTEPNKGSAHGVAPSFPPNNQWPGAIVHTHGADNASDLDDRFSSQDKDMVDGYCADHDRTVLMYLVTPDGRIFAYDPNTSTIYAVDPKPSTDTSDDGDDNNSEETERQLNSVQ